MKKACNILDVNRYTICCIINNSSPWRFSREVFSQTEGQREKCIFLLESTSIKNLKIHKVLTIAKAVKTIKPFFVFKISRMPLTK